MVQTVEGWLTVKDGTKLYTKTWKPDGTPTASLIFLHGFSDHCNAYYDFFPTLSSPPYSIQVHTLDQRGWGRSVRQPSDKGLSGPTSQVLSDINEFTLSISNSNPNTPLFLMGHSMGGAQALHYLLTPQPTRPLISGLLLESPFIALHPSSQPLTLTVLLGKLAARIAPTRQLLQKLNPAHVSRSVAVQKDWSNDPLCHDTGTLQGLAGMLQRGSDLVSLSTNPNTSNLTTKLSCPVWLAHGTADKVTSYNASRELFDVLDVENGDKMFKSYEGGYHKLHAEPEGMGEEFARDVGGWILERSAGKVGPQAKL